MVVSAFTDHTWECSKINSTSMSWWRVYRDGAHVGYLQSQSRSLDAMADYDAFDSAGVRLASNVTSADDSNYTNALILIHRAVEGEK